MELEAQTKALCFCIGLKALLNVSTMERVFEWRELQEQKLRVHVEESGSSGPSRVMTPAQVIRFIQHYERITRHLLAEMPDRADIVFAIDHTHNPAGVTINRPLQ